MGSLKGEVLEFSKCVINTDLTVAVTLSQSDTKARNPSPNTAPAVLREIVY